MQNPKMINFRASSELVEVIGAAAKNAGVSVSEFLRGVVEDRLAEMTADEAPAEGVIDPFSLLSRAAKGSVQAQRALARSGVQMACSGQHDAQSCFREAMIFARLAAAHGDIGDQGLVISIAALMGEVLGDAACEAETAEALARIAIADEAGVEFAGDALRQLVAGASPRLAALAQEYRSRIRNLVTGEAI